MKRTTVAAVFGKIVMEVQFNNIYNICICDICNIDTHIQTHTFTMKLLLQLGFSLNGISHFQFLS